MADKWQPGNRVAALVAGGAEYACVHQDHALAIPDDMSFTDAAALPETIFTVFANVFEGGELQKGETLLCMAVPAALAPQPFKGNIGGLKSSSRLVLNDKCGLP